ncbi:DUF551 domain-containing protein [Escherichia coli]|nr:DUF551 domain-containing protein [Salmonella enterica]QLX56733.1 DUF551 domain-containing protein [Escherichia coli]HCO7155121.1 DUF551 domain-containing protein [Escherichia coli]HCO7274090.1 DUF551 domain-containing protein [Escherichia coli]HCO7279054.1 DUF551 domain-containing protein [Escherichia coli]
MITITKERLLTIKQWRETYGPGSNVVLPAEEAEELARIALASLEAEAVMFCISGQNVDSEEHVSTSKAVVDAWVEEWNQVDGSPGEPLYKTMPLYYHAALPAPVVPEEATPENVEMLSGYVSTYKLTDSERDIAAEIWNACRAAMLQSGNFRENKNSSTNNFREIAETSTNYPVIPSEVLSAIQKVAKIRADFDDFDGDRRGIGDCLDEAEQELIVTINKYASQLAAEPIAPNDVREQTAIPQVPVTPDGWISCSERMPNTKTAVLVAVEFDRKGDWRMKWATYIPGHPDANDGWIIPGASWKPSHWMPLPEPPQEAK